MKINPKVLTNTSYELPQCSDYLYKLDILENHFPTNRNVVNAIKDAMMHNDKTMELINMYPQKQTTYNNLLISIAKYCGVTTDNIIITNGSDSALDLVFNTYLCDDSTVLIPTPNYPHLIQFCMTRNCKEIIYVPLSSESEFNKLHNKLQTNMVDICYISNPNLPYGYQFSVEQIESLVGEFKDTLFLIDEAYYEYGNQTTSATLVNKYTNIVVTRTFSKAFGLAGLRIGYLMTHTDNIRNLSVLHNGKSVTSLSLYAAEAAMKGLKDIKKMVDLTNKIKNGLSNILEKLTSNKDAYIYDYNMQYGNFFLLYCKDSRVVKDIFYQHKVCIRNKHDDIPHTVRICITTEKAVNYCVDIIRKINRVYDQIDNKKLLSRDVVLFDLDGTLRESSNVNAKFFNKAGVLIDKLNDKEVYLITNNASFTPDEIHDTLVKNNIFIKKNHIRSPLTFMKKISEGKKAYVIGNEKTKEYLSHTEFSADNNKYDFVFFVNTFTIDQKTMIEVCTILKNGTPMYFAEKNKLCTVSDCSDIINYEKGYEGVIIPDSGLYIDLFSNITNNVFAVGKPGIDLAEGIKLNNAIMIGNSFTSDIEFGKNLGIDTVFIDIEDGTNQLKYDFIDNTYVIDSVDSLYDNLFL